jgi:DNA-binding response OmpR family regulator
MKLILLEDDRVLCREISQFLIHKNCECSTVYDGEAFFELLENQDFDVYLLDINTPKISGLEVCKRIREKDNRKPILILTAYCNIEDKISAFSLGADDYLVKPFHLEELYLRVSSLLRRSIQPLNEDEIVAVQDLSINISKMKVSRSGMQIELTPKEYKLLLALVQAKGKILSKKSIAEMVWGLDFDTNTNTIEVYINFLRKKIDKNFTNKLVKTKPGYGYFIDEE